MSEGYYLILDGHNSYVAMRAHGAIYFSPKLEWAERFTKKEAKAIVQRGKADLVGRYLGLHIEPEPLPELTLDMIVAMNGFKP